MKGILACALCLVAGQAAALSCLPYEFENAWTDAESSESAFVVVHGTLQFDAARLPQVDWERQQDTPPSTRIEARLTGQSLTRAGFSRPFDRPVILEIACYGPWCATASDGAETLAFVEQTPEGWMLRTNPCGGFVFQSPDEAFLKRARACMNGADCAPKPVPFSNN